MTFDKLNMRIFKIFIFSVLLISITLICIDINGFKYSMRKFNIEYLIYIIIFEILNFAFRFVKWSYYLKLTGVNISLIESLKILLSSFPMSITPGKVGEILKPYLLKVKYNYPMSKTTPMVIIERLSDTIGVLLITAIGALFFKFGIEVFIIVLIILIAGIFIIQSRKFCYLIIDLLRFVPYINRHITAILDFYESTFNLLKVKNLTLGVIIGLAAWACEGIIVFFTFKSVNLNISVLYSIFIISFSSIIGAISMIPGGVVAAEGSLLALVLRLGISKGMGSFIVLVIRFFTTWLGVIVGSIVLLKVEKEISEAGFSFSEATDIENHRIIE